MPEGQNSAFHLPSLTEESILTGLGGMLDGPNSKGTKFFLQMRADSPLTTMTDLKMSGGTKERDLSMFVSSNITVMGETISRCGVASPTITVLVFTWLQGEQ